MTRLGPVIDLDQQPDSAPAWTPGPWHVEQENGPQYGSCWRIVGPAGDVAQIVDTDNPAFADAAALLIAAAPEMYAALVKCADLLALCAPRDPRTGAKMPDPPAVTEARAALAAARGE